MIAILLLLGIFYIVFTMDHGFKWLAPFDIPGFIVSIPITIAAGLVVSLLIVGGLQYTFIKEKVTVKSVTFLQPTLKIDSGKPVLVDKQQEHHPLAISNFADGELDNLTLGNPITLVYDETVMTDDTFIFFTI